MRKKGATRNFRLPIAIALLTIGKYLCQANAQSFLILKKKETFAARARKAPPGNRIYCQADTIEQIDH
jgi:hypothetical protein